MDEETIAGLEGAMAEWTTRLQTLLDLESAKKMDPGGACLLSMPLIGVHCVSIMHVCASLPVLQLVGWRQASVAARGMTMGLQCCMIRAAAWC